MTVSTPQAPPPAPAGGGRPAAAPGRRRPVRLLTGRDRVVLGLMVGVPAVIVLSIVWLPTLATIALSFTDWNGIGSLDRANPVGLQNYDDVVTNYPQFDVAVRNNLLWLGVFFLVATPLGMFMAVLLDRELRGSWFYRSALYLPVVLSLALAGFIWQLQYSRDQGLINALLGLEGAERIDWYGDPSINIWAVLVAASWRHVGYVMLLYLAGLKAVDPALREAAQMDGASEARTFFSVVFPTLAPINIVVLVITVIESLRAFDLVWVINRGRNGLELLSALVTANLIGEATLVGFGSAIATILILISVVFIVVYLGTILREEKR
ncbi:carbohydrate ABC transporter permease [Aquipuribacter sp. SD81]|uniref:carbohydrate ABC transporter permease n=1 Tax=Aquipuribacter sp. SD81 TaxID=3127703 RepID=UPI003016427E